MSETWESVGSYFDVPDEKLCDVSDEEEKECSLVTRQEEIEAAHEFLKRSWVVLKQPAQVQIYNN